MTNSKRSLAGVLTLLVLLPESAALMLEPLGLTEPWTPYAVFYASLAATGLLVLGSPRREP